MSQRKAKISACGLLAATVLSGAFTMASAAAADIPPTDDSLADITAPLPDVNALQSVCAQLSSRGALAACHAELLERQTRVENEMLSGISDEQEALQLRLHVLNNNECVAFKYASSALERDKVDIRRQQEMWGQDVSHWTLTPALEHTASSMFHSGADCFEHLAGLISNRTGLEESVEDLRNLSQEMRALGTQFTLEH